MSQAPRFAAYKCSNFNEDFFISTFSSRAVFVSCKKRSCTKSGIGLDTLDSFTISLTLAFTPLTFFGVWCQAQSVNFFNGLIQFFKKIAVSYTPNFTCRI